MFMKNFQDNEPLSSLTHLVGFFLSIAGLVLLITTAIRYSTAWHLFSFAVFGASLILLYLASTVYHFIPKSNKLTDTFLRIDKSFIFFLIAGSYTPLVLVPLRGSWGWLIFGIVWGTAIAGIIFQIFKKKLNSWITLSLYLALGWFMVLVLPYLAKTLSGPAIAWLIAGGLMYTIGAVFFALDEKWPSRRLFGWHEVFHLFVLGGSLSHFWLMYHYITYLK